MVDKDVDLTAEDQAATDAALADGDEDLRKAIALLQEAGPERVEALAKAMGDDEDDDDEDVDDEGEEDDEDEDESEDEPAEGKGGKSKAAAKKILAEMGLDKEEAAAPARKALTEYMDDEMVEVLDSDEVISGLFKAFEATRHEDLDAVLAKFSKRMKALESSLTNMTKALSANEAPEPLRTGRTKPLEKSLDNPTGRAAGGPTKVEVEAITTAAMQKGLINGQEGTTIDLAFGTPTWASYAPRFAELKAQVDAST